MKVLLSIRKLLALFKNTFIFLITITVIYFITALILSILNTHPPKLNCLPVNEIYITTNGMHVDIILPVENIDFEFLKELELQPGTKYISFGWGDKQFYINTPEWKDLTFKTAFIALFLKSETAMHVTGYYQKYDSWKKLNLCNSQLDTLKHYIENSFRRNDMGNLQKIDVPGYYKIDAFYDARGSFSLFRTCNVWAGKALKVIGVETAVWSPFDFGILYHLKE